MRLSINKFAASAAQYILREVDANLPKYALNFDSETLIERAIAHVMEGAIPDEYFDSLFIMLSHHAEVRAVLNEGQDRVAEWAESADYRTTWSGVGRNYTQSKLREIGMSQSDFL